MPSKWSFQSHLFFHLVKFIMPRSTKKNVFSFTNSFTSCLLGAGGGWVGEGLVRCSWNTEGPAKWKSTRWAQQCKHICPASRQSLSEPDWEKSWSRSSSSSSHGMHRPLSTVAVTSTLCGVVVWISLPRALAPWGGVPHSLTSALGLPPLPWDSLLPCGTILFCDLSCTGSWHLTGRHRDQMSDIMDDVSHSCRPRHLWGLQSILHVPGTTHLPTSTLEEQHFSVKFPLMTDFFFSPPTFSRSVWTTASLAPAQKSQITSPCHSHLHSQVNPKNFCQLGATAYI